MKRLLSVFAILFALTFAGNSQTVNVSSAKLLTTSPLTCDTIDVEISWNLNCINWTFNNFTYVASGSNLTIKVNYTGSPICLPAISFIIDTARLVGVPKGNYTTVKVESYDGTSLIHTYNMSGSINVASCCPAEAEIFGDTSSYCDTDTVSLYGLANGIVNYRWYVNGVLTDTTQFLNYAPTAGGTDSVSLEVDSITCGDTNFAMIRILNDPVMPKDDSVCLDAFHFVTVSGDPWPKYEWSNGRKAPSFTSFQSGTYVLTVTAASGCQKVDSVTITHLGPEFKMGNDTSFCMGGSVDLVIADSSNWSSVLWTPGATTNFTRTVSQTGSYVATVENSIACQFKDTINVTVEDTSLSVMGSDSVCDGGQVALYVAPGHSNLTWSTGSSNDTIYVSSPGTYYANATSASGCRLGGNGTAYFHANPQFNLQNDTTICDGDTIVVIGANPNWDHYWSTGSRDLDIEISDSGRYHLEVVDNNGCKGSDTLIIYLKDCSDTNTGDTTSVRLFEREFGIRLFPNPARDYIQIELIENTSSVNIQLMDLTGRIVIDKSIESGKSHSLDISTLPRGGYILGVETFDGNSVHRKILLE